MNSHEVEVPFEELLWIDLLVDNELTAQQRRRLIEHLEGRPQLWRSCALAFIDNQVLRSELKSSVEPEQEQTILPSRRSGMLGPRLMWVAALAASLVVAFATGRMTAFTPEDVDTSVRVVANESSPDMFHDPKAANRATFVSLPSSDPALIEIKDDEREAVYYLQQPLPPFLLDTIVMAGHGVRAEQVMVEIEVENGVTDVVPINTLIIDKFTLSEKRM